MSKDVKFVLPDGSATDTVRLRTDFGGGANERQIEADEVWLHAPDPDETEIWRRVFRSEPPKDGFTSWDLARLLSSAGAYLRSTFGSAVTLSAEASKDDVERLRAGALQLIQQVREMGEEIEKAEAEAYAAWEAVGDRLWKKRREVEEKIGRLGEDIRVPYGLDQLIELAERLDHLSPAAWDKVKDLAAVLHAGRGG